MANEERLFSVDAKYVNNLKEQARQARKSVRRMKQRLKDKDCDNAIFERALKDIVAHSDVHGFWNHEHIVAQAALDSVIDRRRLIANRKKDG